MRIAAVFVAVVAGLIASLFSRFAALLLYLWFSIFRPVEWAWYGLYGAGLSRVVGLVLVLPCLATGQFPNLTHPLSLGSVLFLGVCIAAQFTAFTPDVGWRWIDQLSRVILVSLFLVTLVNSKRRFIWTMAVVGGSLALHSCKLGIVFVLSGGGAFQAGIGGNFADNNDYGLGIARILFLLIAVSQNVEFGWIRRGFLMAVPLSALGVMATYSRGAFLALLAGTLTFLLLQRRRFLITGGVVLLLYLLLQVVPVPQAYVDRLDTIRTAVSDEGEASARGRLHFWQVAIEMARANPFGVGIRNYEDAYDRYDFLAGAHGASRSVHSSHFQALAETGFLGFLLWLGLFIWTIRVLLRARRRGRCASLRDEDRRFLTTSANALLASTMAFLVGGSFLAQVLNDLNWLTFGLAAALDRISHQMVSTREVSVVASAAALTRGVTGMPARA